MTFKLINTKNIIVKMVNYIRLCMSNVNTAKEKYQAVKLQAVGLAGKANHNEGETYKDIRDSGGTFQSDNLMALGQLYPNLNDNLRSTSNMVESLYNDYKAAQNELNEAITQYNNYIAQFPTNLFAGILGYRQDTLIDEENLSKSKEFSRTADVDISDYV